MPQKSEESVENEYSKIPKYFSFDDCEEVFNTKTDLDDHIKSEHKEEEIKNVSVIFEEEYSEQEPKPLKTLNNYQRNLNVV